MLCFFLVLFLAGFFSSLWIRKEHTRIFLAKIFLWFVLCGGIVFSTIVIWTGLRDYLSGKAESQVLIMLTVSVVILVGAGGSLLYEIFIKRRIELIEIKKLRQRYPASPWKWSKRWRSNTMEYSDKGEMIFSYLITAIIVTGMALSFFMRKEEILRSFHENKTDSLVILYILVMGLLCSVRFAVNSTIRWRNLKRSSFVMSTVPGIIGGKLEGEILTRSRHVPCDGFDLKLSCIEMDITFQESIHGITETVLWESRKKVRVEDIRMGPYGISFPVSFTIPASAEETDTVSRDRRISWVLAAHCAGEEKGLTVVFKVPVFRVTKERAGQ